jgi:nucleoside-diphosphate-sugar epimerase
LRILITGGTGFVGRYLVSVLAARPEFDVIVGMHHNPVSAVQGISESPVTVGDASRARALLDWVPRIELLDSLKLILDWHRGAPLNVGSGIQPTRLRLKPASRVE